MNTTLIPCPFCKTPIPEDCVYCDTCGEKLRKCSSCGSFAKSKRCTKCGQPTQEIVPGTSSSTESADDQIVTSKPRPIPDHLVCLSTDLRIGLSHEAIIGRRGSYGTAFNQFPTISGLHAKLLQTECGWQIEDVGSSNGTFLNGNEIERNKPTDIKIGDVIKFADVEFKVTE